MFKKIVSRISFSPALVAQLGFYAKRLRKEQATRRLGLIFVALALVVQSFVVFQAPEPANAAHPSDMIPGGLGWSNPSLKKFLDAYDTNWGHTQHAAHQFGITRAEIAAAKYGTFKVGTAVGWGWDTQMPNSRLMKVYDYNGKYVRNLYGRQMNQYYPMNKDIPAFIGHSKIRGWFAIAVECGNIVTKDFVSYPEPKPAKIVASKSAVNVTQGKVNATKVSAKEKDTLTYTVSLTNTGGKTTSVTPVDNIKSVLQYATITDAGGGTLNKTKGTLTWPAVTLTPGKSVTKTYSVKMINNLGNSKTNCTMINTFFDKKVTTPVGCYTPETPKPPEPEPKPETPEVNVSVAKNATNTSQGNTDATKTTAQASDRITFTLTATNSGNTATDFTFKDDLTDTLEYSTLIDNGGGSFDATSKTLSWPTIKLAAGAKEVRSFTIQVLSSIPATPVGATQGASYNCKMENSFSADDDTDASTIIKVNCPTQKVVVEQTVSELPKTGAGTNMIFAGIVLSLAAFFYFRSRQLGSEVRLVRRNINEGVF
ncbi:LPXTG cell wall anchor domain-containing protein [Candidatus Saccharibacteria bacterium TM7i]|nr:LPXTG cell wall anchor domain-containing protein [Candidatus Saccharibacteria bacterium TM7i]